MTHDDTRPGEVKLSEAARILGWHPHKLYRRAAAGTIPSRQARPGYARRFDRRTVEMIAEFGDVRRA